MSEENKSPPAEYTPVGYVKLWYAGTQVSVPLPERPVDYRAMLANLDAALAAGFAATLAGLEQGENLDALGWVVRTLHRSRDGGYVSALDLYLPEDKFSKVRLYLNSTDQIQEFERLSGLTLEKIPVYEGTNKVERFKSADSKVIKVPRPMSFVWKANPHYNPDETDPKKKKPARVFVRWEGQQKQAENGAQQPENGATDQALLNRWREFTQSDPPLDVFNSFCEREFPEVPQHLRDRVSSGIRAHAKAAGWVWDDTDKAYVRPNAQPENDRIPF